MLGRDDDVLHPRILGDTRPLVCVEPRGVEAVDVLLVVRDRDVCPAHDPLPDAGNALPLVRAGGDGVGAPVVGACMSAAMATRWQSDIHLRGLGEVGEVGGGSGGCAGSRTA